MPSPTQARGFFRTASKYLTEPHPFARRSLMQQPHEVPWGVYVKHVGRTSVAYFPWFVGVLGWPLGAAAVIDKVGL